MGAMQVDPLPHTTFACLNKDSLLATRQRQDHRPRFRSTVEWPRKLPPLVLEKTEGLLLRSLSIKNIVVRKSRHGTA